MNKQEREIFIKRFKDISNKSPMQIEVWESEYLIKAINSLLDTSLTEEEIEIVSHWGFIASTERLLNDEEKALYFKITE